jgi:hypothetical protein
VESLCGLSVGAAKDVRSVPRAPSSEAAGQPVFSNELDSDDFGCDAPGQHSSNLCPVRRCCSPTVQTTINLVS